MFRSISRRDFMKGMLVGGVAAGSAGFLAACGESASSESSESASTSAEATVEEILANAESSGEEVSTDSAYIDEVNIALSGDLADLSPWGTNNSNGRAYTVTSIYETLLTEGEDGEMAPCLASSYEQVDNCTYNFTLYDYIYDTEGNPLTADDVVFSVNTCLELGSQPPVCNVLVSAEALSDYEVQLKLVDSAGLGDIENVIYNFFIVTQAAYENSGDGMVKNPVGTSHYEVTDFVTSSSLTVVDTQNYWQTEELTAPRSRANVETINYLVITESSQRMIALQNGTVDFAAVAYTDRDTFVNDESFLVTDVLSSGAYCLIPNCSEDSILNNVLLREAVFYAVENSGVSAGYTTALSKVVNGLGSSYYSDYYEDYFDEEAAGNYYTYDPDKAIELIREAGYEPGDLTITLFSQSSQAATDCATVIQAYLNAIGIDCKTVAYDNSVVTSYLEDSSSWDLYVSAYRGDVSWTNVASAFMNPDKFTTGGTMNFIFDDTLQELMATARSAEGHTEENVIAFHDYIVENAYAKGLLVTLNTNVTDSKFAGGFVYQDTSNNAICAGACTFNEE